MTITAADKLRCAERELKYRRRVYPRMVQQGKMRAVEADLEIAVMRAIADDYRAQAEPPLFGLARQP